MQIVAAGESLTLLPQRAIFWAKASTLLIADTHFGKAETLRAAAMPVPHGATGGALARLSRLLEETAAERLVILGDFWHARSGITAELLEELRVWRHEHAELSIVTILGNHDRRTTGLFDDWSSAVHAEPVADSPFVFGHFPEPHPAGYVLAGHLHPGVSLYGRGRQRLALPCFRFGESVAVLPAFGALTGLATAEPQPGESVYAIAGDRVLSIRG